MSITALSSSNYSVQANPDNNQNVRLTITENGDSKTLDLGYGSDFQVLAVVKATESDFSPYNSSTMYPSSMGMGDTQLYYWVAYRYKNSTSDTQAQFKLKSFDANALMGSSNWGREYYDIQPSKVEPFFGVDLNNDTLTDGTVTKTAVSTDTAGVRLKIDADGLHHLTDDGVDYAIAPLGNTSSNYKFDNSSGNYSRQAVAVEKVASSNGSTEPEYLLVVKSVNSGSSGSSGSSSSSTQTSWEVYTLRTQQGWTDYYNSASSNTSGTAGSTGSYYYTPPGSTTTGNTSTQPSVPTLYFNWEPARPSTISGYEVASKLNQDLDGDNSIGIPLQSLTAVSSKTTGLRLEKDSAGNIYIVEGSGNSKTAKTIDNLSSAQYDWSDNTYNTINRSSVKEIAAVTEGNTVVGYKLAVKKESSYSMYSGAASTSGSNNSSGPYVSWDVLYVDAQNPKITWGQWDTRQNKWVDLNERNLTSIVDYEDFFGSDLNSDNRIGLDISTLTPLDSDTEGAKLARAADQALYIISSDETSARPIKADWLESSYRMDQDNYSERKAIAVETITSGGNITGYSLLMKNTNKWGSNQSENVTYDIMRLDANARLLNGEMKDGVWVNYSTYGIKSLAAYEEDFGQDFNNDNFVGINVNNLTQVDTDINGIRLAKDSTGGYYLVDTSTTPATAKAITDAPSLEWSYGTDSRVVVAAEAVRNSSNTITGYKVAVKQTRFDYYSQQNEITWEIINLDANGKANYGTGTMASGGQIKSISAYETDFDQDLNNDNRIGVDTSTLTFVPTDTAGERLAKDAAGALYIVSSSNSTTQAKPVGNSAWMEYNYSWTGGFNKREVLAVEADDSGGSLLGYKLILRNTNSWSGSNGDQVSYDVMYLNTSGVQQYGSMVNNVWVDKNTYGAKSLTPYELVFGEDFNNDGFVGIDPSRLTEVATDRRGVRLRRDSENALYLIDEAAGSSPKAIGNAGMLEYTNSWGSGSNSRVAVGIGSTKDAQGNVTGYKLALKNTNSWDNTTNVNWEILSLDTEGKVSWGSTAAGTGGGSVWTTNIRPFETLIGEDLDGDGAIGVDRSTLTAISTDSSADNVNLAKDSTGQIFILDGANITLALRDNYGTAPMLEYNRSWTGGASTAVLTASGKDSSGNYKIAVKLTQTTGSTEQVSWQIHTVSSEGVLNWTQMATVRSPVRFETVIGQDLDGDGRIGQGTLQLTDVSTDTGSFKLQKDSAGQLYIYDAIDTANNNLTYVVDARGGSPNFDVTLNGYTAAAHAVHKMADGTYRLAVKKTTSTSSGDVIKWDVYTLTARNTSTNEATIDWSKTAFSRDPLEVERLINQDVNGDSVVASARLAPTTALSSDLSTTVTLGRDAENYVWIKDGSSWKEVKDAYGTGVKLDTLETLDDGGSFATETVAATVINGSDGTSSYRIAVKETLTVSADAAPSVQWKIYTVASNGTIDLNPTHTSNISSWESSTRFNQELDGVTAVIGDHASLDPDLAADQLGGIYLKNGDDTLLITDGDGGTPELEYEQLFDSGSTVAKVVAAANEGDTVGNKLLAVEVTTTQDGNSARYWVVHTAEYQDAGTPTDNSDDHYTIDWSAAVITSDMSDYTAIFGQEFVQPTPATLGA